MRTLPDLTQAQAMALMSAAAVRHIALHAVDRHLAEHPDALLTGDPGCPVGLHRLIQALHRAGFSTVRLIGCARCGRTGIRLAWQSKEGRICGRCARQTAPKQPCARCGRTATMQGRRLEGRICGTCVASDPNAFDECGGCGRRARPFRRLPNGSALCQRCAPLKTYRCAVCGRTAPAAVQTTDGPICKSCYPQHAQPLRECSSCHRIRRVKARATAEHGDLCARCVPLPVGTCTSCSRNRPGFHRDGVFLCTSCRAAQRPARECAICDKPRLVNAEWPVGPVCAGCYQHALRRPAACVRCRQLRVLTGSTAAGRTPDLCGPCAGGRDYVCISCKTPGPAVEHGRCARCVLTSRLETTFADTSGNLRGQYATLVTVLAATGQPESLLANWLKPSNPAVQLLTRFAREDTVLDHDLLDELPQTAHLHHLRRLLVFAAIIPPREHEYLDRLGPWLRAQLAGRPEHHARLVNQYAEWDVLHRARRRVRRRDTLAYSTAIYARTNITAALDLLAWLDQRGTSLDRLTQDLLERWLDEPANKYKPISNFLRWAAKSRYAAKLDAPPRRHGHASSSFLEEEQRWRQLRSCLHDQDMPLAVRVVGTLTLLFGVTTSRILELTTDDVRVTPDKVTLTVGSSPIELPPRVADLIRLQLEHANAVELNAPELRRWLFPGQRAALPVHPAHMSDQLVAAGIDALRGRQAALVDLAAALPPAVLAALLGVHISTAIAWSYRAQRDWSTYLAARTDEQRESSIRSPRDDQAQARP